jgi:predicted Zn-dependent protease
VLIHRMLRETSEARRWELIDEADPVIRQLRRIDPDNPAAIKYLGYVEQSRERWPQAISWLSRYQERFPEDPDAYRRLAAIHLRRGDAESRLRQLEQLFRLVQDEPAVACQIASIYRQRGVHARAAEWLARAIEVDPYDVDTHLALAEAYMDAGNYPAAEWEYRVVCKQLPYESAGYAGLSRVLEALGNRAEAEACRKKAEALRVTPRAGRPTG